MTAQQQSVTTGNRGKLLSDGTRKPGPAMFDLQCDVCEADLSFRAVGDVFGNASKRLAAHLFRVHHIQAARRFSYDQSDLSSFYDPHIQ